MQQSSRYSRRRLLGFLLMILGALALSAPLATGKWSLALLGLPLIALSIAEAYAAFASPRRTELNAYLPSVLAMLAGIVLLISTALALTGLVVLLSTILIIDGVSKILAVWREGQGVRVPPMVNGLVDLGCAAVLLYVGQKIGSGRAVGIVIGSYIAAAGWRMLMAGADVELNEVGNATVTGHPDPDLALPPNEAFGRLRAQASNAERAVRATELMWMLTLGAVFLAKIGRA